MITWKTMTVREMIEHLQQFDPEMECVYECCSDYAPFDERRLPCVQQLLFKHERACHYYPRQWENSSVPAPVKEFLVFPGN